MANMKAIRMHEYGGADVLRYEDVPRPEAGDGQVLVRVHAAGVNPADWKLREGYFKETIPLQLPWIPGGDFSGVVESVGTGVTGVRAGDAVFGRADLPNNGSYAEYVAVPATSIAAKPKAVDHVHAAAIPLAALTAWQGLFGSGQGPAIDPRVGTTILILGAAGGVGSFAVQLAKWKGARVVGTALPGQEDHLRSLGTDVIVASDKLADAGQVDGVLDLVGGDLLQRAWAQLARGGTIASTMGPPSEKEAKARGVTPIAVFTRTNAAQLAEISTLVDAGTLKVVVSGTVPLASARQAHEDLAAGKVSGKLVLLVAR